MRNEGNSKFVIVAVTAKYWFVRHLGPPMKLVGRIAILPSGLSGRADFEPILGSAKDSGRRGHRVGHRNEPISSGCERLGQGESTPMY